jgi:hypothetical protein
MMAAKGIPIMTSWLIAPATTLPPEYLIFGRMKTRPFFEAIKGQAHSL